MSLPFSMSSCHTPQVPAGPVHQPSRAELPHTQEDVGEEGQEEVGGGGQAPHVVSQVRHQGVGNLEDVREEPEAPGGPRGVYPLPPASAALP